MSEEHWRTDIHIHIYIYKFVYRFVERILPGAPKTTQAGPREFPGDRRDLLGHPWKQPGHPTNGPLGDPRSVSDAFLLGPRGSFGRFLGIFWMLGRVGPCSSMKLAVVQQGALQEGSGGACGSLGGPRIVLVLRMSLGRSQAFSGISRNL